MHSTCTALLKSEEKGTQTEHCFFYNHLQITSFLIVLRIMNIATKFSILLHRKLDFKKVKVEQSALSIMNTLLFFSEGRREINPCWQMWSKPESRKHHNYHHYGHHACLREKQGGMQAYSVTKFGSLILPFPYFITMYSEMTYMRTTARNLVVMHFISLQLSQLSGQKTRMMLWGAR